MAAAFAATVAAATTVSPPPASAQSDLIAYHQMARWPERTGAAAGLFQSPVDLDAGQDGRVFVADPGIGGVHLLLPSGTFTTPFGVSGGFPAQLGQVGQLAVGPDPDQGLGHDVVYVLDPALDRVAIYTHEGDYLRQWSGVKGQAIVASPTGPVYVLDRETSQVRTFDPATNAELWTWGERGTDDGQFTNFNDVSVTADGKVLVVADKRGQRVQLFNVADQAALDAGQPPLAPRRVYDLRDAKFTQNSQTCSGNRVNALGNDQVFMGQGESACLVDTRTVTFAIASSASSGTICRDTVRLPFLRADTQQYFALAEYDPNPGKCGDKRQDVPTAPVVVSYSDTSLRQVAGVFHAISNDDSQTPVLFSPQQVSMSDADHIFVSDNSSVFRFFDRDGQQVATAARDTRAGDFSTDFEVFRIMNGVGADTVGEVFGNFVHFTRSATSQSGEVGIGRFKTVQKRTQNGPEDVIEAVWADAQVVSSGRLRIEFGPVAFNPITSEVLAVRVETVAQQRTTNVVVVRYTADGRKLSPSWDIPDDGLVNPYVDMLVGPDGRVYLLDDLNDVVRVLAADGTPLLDVPVAFDARAVAGGPPSPDGSVFVLREPGSIERLADDGRVTARLDGRPLAFSDPTTLTDLVVDGDGRVYVADGQTSLITVLEQSADPDEIPVPDDGECLFKGHADAQPTQLDLGDATTVTLHLAGRCGTDEDPADIVVVVPFYRQLDQGTDPAAGTINELLRLTARVNFDRHRLGIVSYYNTTAVELPLTSERQEYTGAVRDVTRFNPPSDQVKARLKNAMEEAAKLFTDDGRRRVMVLMNADYCSTETERTPGECAGYPPAEDTALAIRQSGVTIISVGFGGGGGGGGGRGPRIGGGAALLASSDEDVLFSADQAHRRMVRYRLPAALATDLTLTDRLPANMAVNTASISNGGTWQAPNVVWTAASVDFDGLTESVVVTPTEGGTLLVSEETVADFVDGWGAAQHVTFPVPEVEVIAPTPTASPTPEHTPTPTATATPEATGPSTVFLPILYAQRCETLPVPLEVALVLDVSSSMSQPTEPGGVTKLAAAQAAADAFVAAIRDQDRAAVVAFDAAAHIVSPLSADKDAARRAIGQLAAGSGTAIDLGLLAGRDALGAGRPDALQVLVLLTDGRPSTSADAVRAAGATIRGGGIDLYTVGLGADVDGALLTEVAGDSAHYYFASSTSDLQPIFDELLSRTHIVCP